MTTTMTARSVSSEQPGTIDALSATLQKIADTRSTTYSIGVDRQDVDEGQRRAMLPTNVAVNKDLSRGGVVWFDVTREGARPFLQAAVKESEGVPGAFSLDFRVRNNGPLLSGLARELVAHLRSAIVDASSVREVRIVASVGPDGGHSPESASVIRRALINDGFRPDQQAFDHWLLNDWSDRGGDAYPGPVVRVVAKKSPVYATTLPPLAQRPVAERRSVPLTSVVDNGSARGRGIKIGAGVAAAALLALAATRCGGDDTSDSVTTTTETPVPPSTVVETVVVEKLPAVDAADLVDTATGAYWILAADGTLIEGNGAGALKSEQAFPEGVVALRGAATPDGAGVFVLGSDVSVLSAGAAPQLSRDSFVIFALDNTEFPLTPEWQLPPEWGIVDFVATPTGQGFVLSFDNGIRVAGGDGVDVVRWANGLVVTE